MPFVSINRCEIVIADPRKIIDLIANQSHCELPATTEVAPPTPSRTADRQNDMLYEFIFEPAPRLRKHRRRLLLPKLAMTRSSREFCRCGIFDFFNSIGQKQTSAHVRVMSALSRWSAVAPRDSVETSWMAIAEAPVARK
jgi:hypothetical protein